MKNGKNEKEIKGRHISNKEVFIFLCTLAAIKFLKLMTFLTKYPPFSFISDNYIFHYNNIKANKIKDSIRNSFHVAASIQDRDQYYFYLYYDKKYVHLEKLKKILWNDNVLINEFEDYIKILVPRK